MFHTLHIRDILSIKKKKMQKVMLGYDCESWQVTVCMCSEGFRPSLHMFPDPLSSRLFYYPIKWPRCAWNQEFNLKRNWDQESVNMHTHTHAHTHTHTLTGNLLTSFTAGSGLRLCVWVHLFKGHKNARICKTKPFAHWQALMSALLH